MLSDLLKHHQTLIVGWLRYTVSKPEMSDWEPDGIPAIARQEFIAGFWGRKWRRMSSFDAAGILSGSDANRDVVLSDPASDGI